MMNASEEIVKAYFEHICGLYTRTNIKGEGQCELDLIGVKIGPEISYYHVETTVSIADGFSKITNSIYDPKIEKIRTQSAKQKKTAGYFINKKFYSEQVLATYKSLNIDKENVKRIVVAWDFEDDAKNALSANNIEAKSIKDIFQELATHLALETSNIDSDILKTIQLLVRSGIEMPKIISNNKARKMKKEKIK
jgi:hypothetical protein